MDELESLITRKRDERIAGIEAHKLANRRQVVEERIRCALENCRLYCPPQTYWDGPKLLTISGDFSSWAKNVAGSLIDLAAALNSDHEAAVAARCRLAEAKAGDEDQETAHALLRKAIELEQGIRGEAAEQREQRGVAIESLASSIRGIPADDTYWWGRLTGRILERLLYGNMLAAELLPEAEEPVPASAAPGSTKSRSVVWHSADEVPPAEYKFGPIRGTKAQLVKWLLPNANDKRSRGLDKLLPQFWLRQDGPRMRSAWFKNETSFTEATSRVQADEEARA